MKTNETYTPEQFEKSLVLRGYMKTHEARKYVSDSKKEQYTELDFEDAYRAANREYMRNEPIRGLTSDGRNKFDAMYWGNKK